MSKVKTVNFNAEDIKALGLPEDATTKDLRVLIRTKLGLKLERRRRTEKYAEIREKLGLPKGANANTILSTMKEKGMI